jgi:hypothetical protein
VHRCHEPAVEAAVARHHCAVPLIGSIGLFHIASVPGREGSS